MALRCLNLGCGNDYRESTDEVRWVNLDSGECRADIVADIEEPLIFGDNEFDSIVAIQVLEHVERKNFASVIRELYRISKDGCLWDIRVPHGFSDNFITDPTHSMPFSLRTFDFFIDGTQLRENGIIYGWGDVHLYHKSPPQLDQFQSIMFSLGVQK